MWKVNNELNTYIINFTIELILCNVCKQIMNSGGTILENVIVRWRELYWNLCLLLLR